MVYTICISGDTNPFVGSRRCVSNTLTERELSIKCDVKPAGCAIQTQLIV